MFGKVHFHFYILVWDLLGLWSVLNSECDSVALYHFQQFYMATICWCSAAPGFHLAKIMATISMFAIFSTSDGICSTAEERSPTRSTARYRASADYYLWLHTVTSCAVKWVLLFASFHFVFFFFVFHSVFLCYHVFIACLVEHSPDLVAFKTLQDLPQLWVFF